MIDEKDKRFLLFYEKYRRGEQSRWYRKRYETYERAHRDSVTLATLILFLSSAASTLSIAIPKPRVYGDMYLSWPVLAAVLAAAGTAVTAYRSLYGFQENARLYRDAENSLAAVLADSPVECENCPDAAIRTAADYLPRVEEVFRREQSQWGQLVAQIRVTIPTGKGETAGPGAGAGVAAAGAAARAAGEGAQNGGGGDGNGGGGGGGGNVPGGGAGVGGAGGGGVSAGAGVGANVESPARTGEGDAGDTPAQPAANAATETAAPAQTTTPAVDPAAGAPPAEPVTETGSVDPTPPDVMGDEPDDEPPPGDSSGAVG